MMHSLTRRPWRSIPHKQNTSKWGKQIFSPSLSRRRRIAKWKQIEISYGFEMLWLISLNIFHSYDWKMQAHERVDCTMEETTTELSSLDSQNNPSHLKRASTEKLREIFNRYASKEINGEKYMTSEDFVRKYLGLFPDQDFNEVRNCSLI